MRATRRTYGCPVEFSLDRLGGKWKPVILARLKEGPMRYGELRRALPGLSDKVLTERLRGLEADGFVLGVEEGRGAVRYRLTPLGDSLRPVLEALYAWGEHNAGPMGAMIASPGGGGAAA